MPAHVNYCSTVVTPQLLLHSISASNALMKDPGNLCLGNLKMLFFVFTERIQLSHTQTHHHLSLLYNTRGLHPTIESIRKVKVSMDKFVIHHVSYPVQLLCKGFLHIITFWHSLSLYRLPLFELPPSSLYYFRLCSTTLLNFFVCGYVLGRSVVHVPSFI